MPPKYSPSVWFGALPRIGASHVCRCVSTKPGMTMSPLASITCASAALRLWPTAAIESPSMSTSAPGCSPRLASIVRTKPPRIRIRSATRCSYSHAHVRDRVVVFRPSMSEALQRFNREAHDVRAAELHGVAGATDPVRLSARQSQLIGQPRISVGRHRGVVLEIVGDRGVGGRCRIAGRLSQLLGYLA